MRLRLNNLSIVINIDQEDILTTVIRTLQRIMDLILICTEMSNKIHRKKGLESMIKDKERENQDRKARKKVQNLNKILETNFMNGKMI